MDETGERSLIQKDSLKFDLLRTLLERPVLFSPGEEVLFKDQDSMEIITSSSLTPKLTPAQELELAKANIKGLMANVSLPKDAKILHMGCGEGYYCLILRHLGYNVTGGDVKQKNINKAKDLAEKKGMVINYTCGAYTKIDYSNEFDFIFMTSAIFSTLTDVERKSLLLKVYEALKPNGIFAFDVTTREYRKTAICSNNWDFVDLGFWQGGQHLILKTGFDYPENDAYLELSLVVDKSGKLQVFKSWYQDYSRTTISTLLEMHNFKTDKIYSDLTCTPYEETSKYIGIISHKE